MKAALRFFSVASLLGFCVHASALTVSVDVIQHSICGRPTGVIGVVPDGGIPPYTYEWSNFQQEQVIGGLTAGFYSVTVFDSMGESASGGGTIQDLSSYPSGYLNSYQVPMSYCDGESPRVAIWHGVTNGQSPPPEDIYGPMPYSYDHPDLVDVLSYTTACGLTNVDWYQLLVFDAAPGQGLVVNYTDGDGCPGQVDVYLKQPIEWPAIQVVGVAGTCSTASVGTVTVSVGAQPQFNQHSIMVYARPVNDFASCPTYGGLPGFVVEPPGAEFPTMQTISGLAGGDYWLVWTTDPLSLQSNNPSDWEACKDSVLFNVPVVSTDCGSVSGTFFVDVSGNCLPGSGEPRVPQGVVEITPGPYYVTTSQNGSYSTVLPFGDYTFTELHPVLDQSCPGTLTVATTGNQTRHIGCAPLGFMDVDAGIGSGIARPGFLIPISVSVENLTPDPTGTITVTLNVDPLFSVVSTEPAGIVVGNTITWTAPEFEINNAFGTGYARAWVQVPPDVLLIGTSVSHDVSVTTSNTDANMSNNTASIAQVITGSYDPNDKTARTTNGSSTIWTIDEDEWIDYLIRFQNTGTDTAFNVVITDTLPSTLDPSTIEWDLASHSHLRYLEGQGIVRFVFPNILLPDSNVNEPFSHGFVSFRIRPHLPLFPGTVIENAANIYFDYNPPVITEPSVLVAEFSTGVLAQEQEVMRLVPNPVSDELRISANSNIASLRVIAADGREVLTRSVRTANASIAVDRLQAGAYLLIATFTDGTEARERFIKN
ncbi:MAG TPA: T9SS type A sorting domain-containing protein [Flavobacteriales bacterium]|nr:T9SS type A sorting domain-containing protein [Flavobacteriales bacterium]